MKILRPGALVSIAVSAMLMTTTRPALGQTNLNFNGISATDEGAIQISWNSTSNETYEIDEADALDTNSDGSTQWNLLYTEYPAQGTSTFWLDTGNYFASPEIVHPKYSPARFYRIVDLGSDNTTDEPSVTIIAPTNGNVGSDTLTVTVTASSDQSFLTTALFVDGQQMNDSDIMVGTNSADGVTNYETDTYYLNTCEWFNGPHTLFATARCQSGAIGTHDQTPPTVGTPCRHLSL
ncbi:MAG TPA: Ig-like domain-containing protein [Verrucomicrobiae bacterium]|nr:Ig-like domain-containing protein [Verrucomicrobiae bacterium]